MGCTARSAELAALSTHLLPNAFPTTLHARRERASAVISKVHPPSVIRQLLGSRTMI